jgi:hypothetical protein
VRPQARVFRASNLIVRRPEATIARLCRKACGRAQ